MTGHAIFPFKLSLDVYGCSFLSSNVPYMGKFILKQLLQFFRHYFSCIANVKSLESSRLFQTILSNYYCWNAFVNPKRKNTYENCGTQSTRNNTVRHKKCCSAGTLHCNHCPNFSTISQIDLSCHIAKKHSAAKPDVAFKCKPFCQDFPGF